jgi:uncharacterized protein (TIGR02246 family)
MTAQSSTSPSPPIAADTIRDPETLHVHFCAACNAGDLGRLVSLYEPDAVIVEPTGELTTGTEAIREHIAKLLAMQPAMLILSSKTVVNGDLAQSSSHWECDATAPDGTAVHMEHWGSELSRRQPDGNWRILIDNPWGAQPAIS